LMYLNYWQVIFMGQDRAGEAYLKINLSYIFKNFFELFGIYCELIYSSAVYIIPLIVVFSSILILSRKKENKFNNTARPYIYISFLSSLFFSIIALWLAPIKIIRYIAPVLPFTLLIIPYGASLIKNKKIRYFLLLCLVCVYGFNAFNPSKIDYLYKNKNQEIRVLKDEKKPLYLLSDVNYRMFLEWVPYSKDKDRLFFSNNAEECYNLINLGDSSSLYVAIDAEYDSTKKEKLINLIGEKYFIVNNFFTRSGDTAGFNLLELQIKQ